MYPRLLQLGHIAIPTYGAVTALALIAGLAAAVAVARRLGLDPNRIWSLCMVAILATLIAARLLLVAAYFSAFRQHPLWILGLTTIHNSWIVALSLLIGAAAAALYALAEGLPLLAAFDAMAPAAALAVAINRIGAFLAGLDYGTPARSWSVTYTSRIAARWYRTPIGVPLHPVQLYQAAAALLTLAILLGWLPRRTQNGELAGAGLFLYGLASFFLSFLSAAPGVIPLAQPAAILAVIAAGALWVHRTNVSESDPV